MKTIEFTKDYQSHIINDLKGNVARQKLQAVQRHISDGNQAFMNSLQDLGTHVGILLSEVIVNPSFASFCSAFRDSAKNSFILYINWIYKDLLPHGKDRDRCTFKELNFNGNTNKHSNLEVNQDFENYIKSFNALLKDLDDLCDIDAFSALSLSRADTSYFNFMCGDDLIQFALDEDIARDAFTGGPVISVNYRVSSTNSKRRRTIMITSSRGEPLIGECGLIDDEDIHSIIVPLSAEDADHLDHIVHVDVKTYQETEVHHESRVKEEPRFFGLFTKETYIPEWSETVEREIDHQSFSLSRVYAGNGEGDW